MANVNATLVEQIFYVSKRKWEPDVQHHRQADDLWTGFEVAEWGASRHHVRLWDRPALLNAVYSDNAEGM